MVRAVLDSSALVSAFLTPRGVAADLLRAAQRGILYQRFIRQVLEEAVQRPAGLQRFKAASPCRRFTLLARVEHNV